MGDETPKLEKLIGHRPLGRILKKEEIAAEFALIRKAFEEEKRRAPDASDFRLVGEASGTHFLKLITPRAETGQHLLKIQRGAVAQVSALYPSLNASMAPVAKTIFRPFEVENHTTRSLVDHVRNPDELSPTVTTAFADVFGQDSLAALRETLTAPLPDITALPAAEFPIIFLPRPGGGDLQVTPVAPAESYVRFRDVTAPYFLKQAEGDPPVPRGRWHRQIVTTKQQNISSAIGAQRTRFLASMPRVLDRYSGELYRYAQGGSFPRWRDESIAEAVARYAALLDTTQSYSNADIKAGLDRRADQLINAADLFINEVLVDVELEYAGKGPSERPKVIDVILSGRWKGDERDRARRVLTSDHFKGRLKAARGH